MSPIRRLICAAIRSAAFAILVSSAALAAQLYAWREFPTLTDVSLSLACAPRHALMLIALAVSESALPSARSESFVVQSLSEKSRQVR